MAALTFVQESEIFLGGNSEEEGEDKKGNHADATELLRDRIERDVGMGIRFLLEAQQKTDQNSMRGAVPGMYSGKKPAALSKSNDDEEEGSEDGEEDYHLAEVRVDYVQHSMSAVIAYESYLLSKTQQAKKRFHEIVHEKVRNVADPILHHVRKKIDTATRSSTFVNYSILALLLCFVVAVIALAYCPLSILPSSRSHRTRRRRLKRRD